MNNQLKAQVLEQIQKANNVLVTVSANPTVDELAASVGLTLLLNKLDKHATTVFSGVVPSTIEFLQPEMTIETTTDSLRDFIIALDKSKADKLRYKVEDDVVRIFITPYRSTITENDLEFSHGDFNVDVVIGLGVVRREDLDTAITAHGRILHDATVIALTKQDSVSDIGAINWQEPQASSLCEMVAALAYELQPDSIDGQMATAFLTGIIAETDRFKNQLTSPLTLSLSSQLLASGANQQLIAQKLDEPVLAMAAESPEDKAVSADGELSIDHDSDLELKHNDTIEIDDNGTIRVESSDPAGDEPQKPVDSRSQYEKPVFADEANDLFAELVTAEDGLPTEPEHTMPTMMHEKVIQPLPGSDLVQKSDKPFDLQEALKESMPQDPPAAPAPTPLPATQQTVEAPVVTTDSTPPSDTLAQLEQAVDSPHLQDGQGMVANNDLVQSAQQAVAAAAAATPGYPMPQQAVGAQPIDLGKEPALPQESTQDQQAPPPVPPPPMMPQFFNADGSNDNPFTGTDQQQ